MPVKISNQERLAIIAAIDAGKKFGFGNLISHLATAWARVLVQKWHHSEPQAREAAWGIKGYPFAMQDDLLERGEWDETGERYKTAEHKDHA